MTKNEALIIQFEKTVKNLDEIIKRLATSSDSDRAIYRDSAIQRFEIAFDVSWKSLKEILREEYGVEIASPKKAFQEAFKQGIIENDTIWIDMCDMRNETSHAYNEQYAEGVVSNLPQIYTSLNNLLWKLKK